MFLSIFLSTFSVYGSVLTEAVTVLGRYKHISVTIARGFASSVPVFTSDINKAPVNQSKPQRRSRAEVSSVVTEKTVRILSMDGGGIRALVALKVLQAVENTLRRRASAVNPTEGGIQLGNQRIFDHFDLIVGTSSGALSALALSLPGKIGNNLEAPDSVPGSINDLIQLYSKDPEELFGTRLRSLSTAAFPFRAFRRIKQVFARKYDNTSMKSYFEKFFEQNKLSNAQTNILVPAYQIDRRKTFVFHNFPKIVQKDERGRPKILDWKVGEDLWMGNNDKQLPFPDFLMSDVAMAASAAPTYFTPYRIDFNDDRRDGHKMVDSGIFLNNPTLLGYIHAKRIFPTANRFVIVSLGTGDNVQQPLNYSLPGGGGAVWGSKFLEILDGGTTSVTDEQVKSLLNVENPRNRHYRINPTIPPTPLDETREFKRDILIQSVTNHFDDQNNMNQLNEIVDELMVQRTYPIKIPGFPAYDPYFADQFQRIFRNRT